MANADGDGRTVLVTGGSGFLGGWCLVELLRRGYRPRTTLRDLGRETEVRDAVSSQGVDASGLEFVAADLLRDEGWAEAVDGCDFVLHVASPFPPVQPKDPDELIVPAREGTRRVLGAALEAGAERVVVTSSVAAIRGGISAAAAPLTEADWTDPDAPGVPAYTRSKTLAERAAWDLAGERGEVGKLATVNPGAIIGPLIGDDSYSLQAIERLLGGAPGTPRIGFSFVDVRDVADLHIRAMTAPEAGGERFIAVDRFLWLSEVAAMLRAHLGEAAAKVPKRRVPDFAVRAMALFDPDLRSVAGQLGERVELSSEKARTKLSWTTRPTEQSVVECARSLLERNR